LDPTLKAVGLRHRDCYQTRHTFATTALMAGVNPAYIARQLGHTNMGMLLKHYARWIDGADKGREATLVNKLFVHELFTSGHGPLNLQGKGGGDAATRYQ